MENILFDEYMNVHLIYLCLCKPLDEGCSLRLSKDEDFE
jgi:hypothetical protein